MSDGTTLKDLARLLNAPYTGSGEVVITGVAGLVEAGPHEISWVAERKYAAALARSSAGAVIVGKDVWKAAMPTITVDDPSLAIIRVMEHFSPAPDHPPVGRHSTAVVAESAEVEASAAVGAYAFVGEKARIGRNTVLYPHVYVGAETTIGDGCILYPSVVVRERCRIGHRVILHPHVTIGADGFGYQLDKGQHRKIPQIGTVVIEDDVEVGAGACIDRAKFGVTRIGEGTKIDNLVQVAHNVQVGQHCLLVAQVGIAGSARLGSYVVLGGKVGVRDHVAIGDQVQTAACSCISKDVPAGQVLMGIPAYDVKAFFRDQSLLRRLDRYVARIKELNKRVERLESAADD
jgi:UDP-3-O-[3-hydroxymyristoyl] glucosamine N-acyltransferase